MNIFTRILYFVGVFMDWLSQVWQFIVDLIKDNSLLAEILFIVGIFIIATVIIHLIWGIFDRF